MHWVTSTAPAHERVDPLGSDRTLCEEAKERMNMGKNRVSKHTIFMGKKEKAAAAGSIERKKEKRHSRLLQDQRQK
jgi:hypothetical protein